MSLLRWERRLRERVERAGGRWERVDYARVGAGGKVRAFRISPPEPRALLLTVHGAGNDALFGLASLIRAALARGVAVFAFDLDGHGRGGETRLRADELREIVPAALRHSGAAEAGLPVHVYGVSFGGALLLHSLPDLAPAPVSATLAVAPLRVRFGLLPVLNELRPRLLRTAWRHRSDFGLAGLLPSFGPFRRDTYPLRLDEPASGRFGYVERLNEMLASLDLESRARGVTVPTLLIYGDADRVVPAAQARRLAAALPGSRLVVVPGGSHLTTPLDPRALRATREWIDVGQPAERLDGSTS